MSKHPLAAAALVLAFCAVAPSVAPTAAMAQDPPPANPPATAPPVVETPDQKAAAYIKATRTAMAKQPEADARASIAELVKIWENAVVSAETKKGAVELLMKYARMSDKVPVAVAGIAAFASLSPAEGGKAALDLIEHELKQKAPNKQIYGAAFTSLKKLADPSKGTVSALVEYLKYKDDEVVAKACDAMSGYKAAPGKLRKEMFEEVLKQTEGIAAGAKQSDNANAKRKWNIIQANVNAALQALSGQASLADPAAARSWYNDNKKNDKVWG